MANRFRLETRYEGEEGAPHITHSDTMIEAEELRRSIQASCARATDGNIGVEVKIIDTQNGKYESKTGGSAFPVPENPEAPTYAGQSPTHGMTLLDYFAAQALNGYLKRAERPPSPEDAARLAFDYAEAMLKEREGRL